MAVEIKQYSAYRKSTMKWLEIIPEHWAELCLGKIANIYAGGTPNKQEKYFWDGDIPWLNSGTVNQWMITKPSAYITTEGYESSSTKWIPQGALVIALAGQGKTKGMCAQLGINATCNQSMAAILPRFGENRYLLYWLHVNYRNIRSMASDDLRDGLNLTMLKQIPVPFPPFEEQKKIVSFLDREITKTEMLVAEQKKLITLLTEKRQAIISHAVTKGLDADVPMKDSGVAWLGEVPKYWKIERLKFSIKLNPPKTEIMHLPENTEVSFLPMETIGSDGSLCLKNTRLISDVKDGYTYFRNDDVVLAKITPCFENGKGAIMHNLHNGCGFGTTELIVARPKSTRITKSHLHYIFISSLFRKIGEGTMYGSGGQKRLSDDFVQNFIIPLPPVEEQLTINTFLDRKTSKIDKLITEVNRAIELLKERRTALISAAVTGKIDVRDINQNLPMESSPDVQFTPGTPL